MLATTHVIAGALVGAQCRTVPQAAALGVASHFALDSIPHWGCKDHDTFLKVARVDGIVLLGVLAAVAVAAPPPVRARMVAGAVGGLTPDLNKPFEHFFGRSPFPAAVDRFHSAIQNESPDRVPVEVVAAVTLSSALLTSLARARRSWGARGSS